MLKNIMSVLLKKKQLYYYLQYGGMLETEVYLHRILKHIHKIEESELDILLDIVKSKDEYIIYQKLQEFINKYNL